MYMYAIQIVQGGKLSQLQGLIKMYQKTFMVASFKYDE